MADALYEQFLHPPSRYRGKPLWSWNGELEEAELIRQIHAFKEMGFGGFYIHSRVGLKTEYLGERWMQLTRLCAKEAKQLGMEAWLYDEDRWPSGTAGGMVTEEPRFRLKFLRAAIFTPERFEWTDDTVAAFVCRMQENAVRECVQLHPDAQANELLEHVSPGTHQKAVPWVVLAFRTSEMATSTFYNGTTYVDTMNREATDQFLNLTHERYLSACGDLFGNTIQGIFTDEPHRGSLMDGFGILNADKQLHAPWTYDLFERFQDAFGYSLVPRLPELFFQLNGETVSQVKWHYVELLQRLFLERFAAPVQEWCRTHGLRLTGHVLHEDSLTAQTAMSGSVMRYYEYMDEPGIDVLTEGNRCYWIAKQLSSAARQLGKAQLLSELYGCTGWQFSFQGHKAVGDWQALFGVNSRSHHLAWYTMEGESKRDFPGSIGPQSVWWREYEQVETYFARIGAMMSAGRPVCDVLVVNPVESVWCQVYAGWSDNLQTASPGVAKLEAGYRKLFHALAGAQLDFDYGDEDFLLRFGSVSRDAEGFPVLAVGEAAYRVVVLSGLLTIRSSTLALLHAFQKEGGCIVFQGEPPAYVDALPSDAIASLAIKAENAGDDEYDIVAQSCAALVRVRVKATDVRTGQQLPHIFCQVRQTEDAYALLFQSTDRENEWREVSLEIGLTGSIEQWDARTGKRMAVPAIERAGQIKLITDFPPSGERLYLIRRAVSTAKEHNEIEKMFIGEWTQPFRYRLNEPNVCVLDRACCRIEGEQWEAERDILQVDRLLRDRFDLERRNNKMIQPWYAIKHGEWPAKAVARASLAFHFDVDTTALAISGESSGREGSFGHELDWMLAVERPEQFAIRLNGRLLENRPSDLHWVDCCFRLLPVPLTMLRPGENELILDFDFHERFDLEPVYLLGGFGVKLEGTKKTIQRLPERVLTGNLAEQGFPFYGGMIALELGSTVSSEAEDRPVSAVVSHGSHYAVSLPAVDGACAKLVLASGEEHRLPWQPYEACLDAEQLEQIQELQIFLSRRNTFGPLHMVPVHSPAYAPDHFHTTGERYAEEYVLWPSGLPSFPQLFELRAHIRGKNDDA